jgi:hypothetical protein
MSCPICVDDYDNRTKRKVICNFCQAENCRSCLEKYLLSSQQEVPHCMYCRHEWSMDFLAEETPNSFHNMKFRNHQAKILMDKEMSLLPQTQVAVVILLDQRKDEKRISDECDVIQSEINELEMQCARLRNQMWVVQRSAANNGGVRDIKKEKEERKKFTRACPLEECRGFLSTQWKCGTCESWFCPKCMDPKDGKNDETHLCDQDKVKTMDMLNNNTKPCPGCGEGILGFLGVI